MMTRSIAMRNIHLLLTVLLLCIFAQAALAGNRSQELEIPTESALYAAAGQAFAAGLVPAAACAAPPKLCNHAPGQHFPGGGATPLALIDAAAAGWFGWRACLASELRSCRKTSLCRFAFKVLGAP